MSNEMVLVHKGEFAGKVLRRVSDDGQKVVLKHRDGEEELLPGDVELVEQTPPYAEIFHIHSVSERGKVSIRDENGLHVALALGADAHMLAAAPALLALVERLLPYARAAADEEKGGAQAWSPLGDLAVVGEAEASIDFLKRERVECEECLGTSHECEACHGLGVLTGGPPKVAVTVTEGEDEYGQHMTVTVGAAAQRFRRVKQSQFLMGSPKSEVGRYDDEGPQRLVTLTEVYWLGETPVTQDFWTAITGKNPSRFKGGTRPVEKVSYPDVLAFITKLNSLVPDFGARLPTEAEWENACRAGTTTATWAGDLDQPYGTSAVLDPIAWYYGNSSEGTQPVGTKAANPWGFKDMLGNVWEWTSSLYGPYTSDTADAVVNPSGASPSSSSDSVGAGRVVRGGSWFISPWYVRAAYRFDYSPGLRYDDLGFRLARGPQV